MPDINPKPLLHLYCTDKVLVQRCILATTSQTNGAWIAETRAMKLIESML
ncbi:MAG: hypothetical protein KME29_15350 [Calothrix sp. FI2-JRJ7]|nr:hypothetical protein [Calothrix sp. FI2-JRJ7]